MLLSCFIYTFSLLVNIVAISAKNVIPCSKSESCNTESCNLSKTIGLGFHGETFRIVVLGGSDISMFPVLWKYLLYLCAQCTVVHVCMYNICDTGMHT